MSAPVPPNLPPTAAATPVSASAAARGTVLSLPANTSLAQGQALSAQVVSSGSGQLVLATQIGRVTVQSTATFARGTAILLHVQSTGEAPQVTLHLPQAAGPPQGGPVPNTSPAAAPVPQTAPPPVTTHLTEGSIVQASVTRGVLPPSPGTPPAATTALPAGPQPPAVASAAAQAPTAPPVTTTLAAGANLTLRVLAVSPPGAEPPPAASLATHSAGRLLPAVVIGHQAGGAPIVAAGTAEIALSSAAPLPTGSLLLLELLTLRAPAPGEPGVAPTLFGRRWDSLSEALAVLQRLDPVLARQVAEGIIPAPGPRLAGSMLFFLSAVFSGEIRRFLDADTMRQIARAQGGLDARLTSELSQMQRAATDSSGQDWRLFLVPVLTDKGLEQLRFMLRKDEGEGRSGDDDPGTRFMIEVDMSRLGPFQFDGLARKKHLDLVVRTHNELPPDMREEIRSIFGNTVTALGFTGTIAFRAVPRFEISPVEQPARPQKDLTV